MKTISEPDLSISSNPFKRGISKNIYTLATSTNPIERGIATGILNIARATGAKERTEKLKKESSKKEREELLIFLQGDDTIKKLKDVNINPNLFKISVLKNYPYGLEGTLVHLISSFGKLIKGAKKEKAKTIDIKNMDFIVGRMMRQDFDLRNDDFVKLENKDLNEDLDTIERRFSTSLKIQQVGASSKIVKKQVYKNKKKVLSKKKKKVLKRKVPKKKVPKKKVLSKKKVSKKLKK